MKAADLFKYVLPGYAVVCFLEEEGEGLINKDFSEKVTLIL